MAYNSDLISMLGVFTSYNRYMHLTSWKMEKMHKLLCIMHLDNLCMEFLDDFTVNHLIWMVLG